jgi:hypothetical protein
VSGRKAKSVDLGSSLTRKEKGMRESLNIIVSMGMGYIVLLMAID